MKLEDIPGHSVSKPLFVYQAMIFARYASGELMKDIATSLGVSPNDIQKICKMWREANPEIKIKRKRPKIAKKKVAYVNWRKCSAVRSATDYWISKVPADVAKQQGEFEIAMMIKRALKNGAKAAAIAKRLGISRSAVYTRSRKRFSRPPIERYLRETPFSWR